MTGGMASALYCANANANANASSVLGLYRHRPVALGPSVPARPRGVWAPRWLVHALAQAIDADRPGSSGIDPSLVGMLHDPYAAFAQAWRAAEGQPDAAHRQVMLAYDYYHAMVYATASRLLDDPAEAEDVAQAVFETLARRRTSVRDPMAVSAFLKTCAVRRSLSVVRRRRRSRERLRRVADPSRPAASLDPDAELVASVRQVLARLDPQERTAVVLRYVERHSLAEVARLMGQSVSTVQRRLRQAGERLRAALAEGAEPTLAGCVASMNQDREVRA